MSVYLMKVIPETCRVHKLDIHVYDALMREVLVFK